jgi:anthranilate synthase
MASLDSKHYTTPSGLRVSYQSCVLPERGVSAIAALSDDLDSHPGCLLASTYEYPGRYTRFDLGFSRPPLAITAFTVLVRG